MNLIMHNLPHGSRTFAKIAGAMSIMMGIAIVVSWYYYSSISTDLIYIFTRTSPEAALCFILSGLILLAYSEASYTALTYRIVQIGAVIILLLAVFAILKQLLQYKLFIDAISFNTLFFRHSEAALMLAMSPYSAVNFLLIGFCLLFLDSNIISYRVHQILMSLVILFSLFVLIGHIYNVGSAEVFGIPVAYSQMAPQNAFLFLLIAAAIIFVRPYLGIFSVIASKQRGGSLARRLILPAILLPVLAGYITGIASETFEIINSDLEVSLIVIVTILLLLIFIFINAVYVDKEDVDRIHAVRASKYYKYQLQEILNHTSSIIYLQDLQGKYLMFNKHFEDVFNKKANTILNKNSAEVFGEKYHSKFVEIKEKLLHDKKLLELEESFVVNKNLIHYISNKFLLFDEESDPYAIATVSTDITELKNINAKLIEHEQRLRLALESAHAGIWNLDIAKNRMTYDEDLKKLFCISNHKDSLSFKEFISLIHPDDQTRVYKEIQYSIVGNTEYDTDYRVIYPDDSVHNISSRGHVYRDQANKAVRMSGVCSEVTRYKVVEEELRQSKFAAEILAEKAEESNRTKSAFLAAMSHEIRTPMNGIIGMSDILIDTPLTLEQSIQVKTIRDSSQILLSIVNDILDYTKIESGRIELHNASFSLKLLIHESISMIQTQAKHKEININIVFDSSIPEYLVGDKMRIKQVLGNLLNNAIKFTNKGNVHLHAKRLDHSTKIKLLFEVIDTGVGISSEVLPRLFEPFTQGDSSVSRKHGGTGLGLAISKRLVNIMHGEIGVDSTKNKGSRFWFTLSLKESSTVEEDSSVFVNANLRDVYANQNKNDIFNILLVEDNIINQQVTQTVLNKLGYKLDIVSNGFEALNAYKTKSYDLILMDCQMPEMDGYTATQQIRLLETSSDRHTPIIAMTAHALIGDREKCITAGMDDYISKPFEINNLAKILNKYLNNQDEIGIASTVNPIKKENEIVNIDMKRLHDIFGNDQESINKFIRTFIDSTLGLFNEIKISLDAKNAVAAKKAFHTLKGSSGNSGVTNLYELAIEAEKAVIDSDWKKATDLFANMELILNEMKNEYS